MSVELELAETRQQANQYLKQVNAKLSIVKCGRKLYWQGMLPPKPGSTRTEPHQQTVNVSNHPSRVGSQLSRLLFCPSIWSGPTISTRF